MAPVHLRVEFDELQQCCIWLQGSLTAHLRADALRLKQQQLVD